MYPVATQKDVADLRMFISISYNARANHTDIKIFHYVAIDIIML